MANVNALTGLLQEVYVFISTVAYNHCTYVGPVASQRHECNAYHPRNRSKSGYSNIACHLSSTHRHV